MHLYQIRERALASGRAVFSVQQLATLIGSSYDVAKSYASRLVKKGFAQRLVRGKLTFIDDPFVIATQLVEPSYISGYSALLFHNLTTEIPRYVEVITTRRSIVYAELGLHYYKVKPNIFYGYKKYKKGKSYVFVAEPEKALIDGLYLGILPETLIEEVGAFLNRERLIHYLCRFNAKGKKKLERLLL